MYTEKKKTQQALQIKKPQQALQSLHIFSVLWIWLFIFGDVLFGDRRHKWQTTANSVETGSCLHEIQQGLCNQLWLISQIVIQELSDTEPAWLWRQAGCIHIVSRGWWPGPQVTQVQDGESGSSNSVSILLVLALCVLPVPCEWEGNTILK